MAQPRPSYGTAAQNGLLEQADSGRSALLRQEKVRARREKAQTNNISLAETVAVPATRQPELSDSSVDEFGRLKLANNEVSASDLDQELESDEEFDEEDEENDYDEDEVDGDEYDDSSIATRLRSMKRSAARATGSDKVATESNGLIKDGFSAGTDFLLRQSWYNIIDSFGATLIWINCHIFLRFVVGEDYFKKLGHEWETMGAAKLETAVAGAEAKEALRLAGDRIGLGETMLVILLDLIVLFALLWFFVQVVLVVALITKLGDTALQALTGPFAAIVDTINLFLGNK